MYVKYTNSLITQKDGGLPKTLGAPLVWPKKKVNMKLILYCQSLICTDFKFGFRNIVHYFGSQSDFNTLTCLTKSSEHIFADW